MGVENRCERTDLRRESEDSHPRRPRPVNAVSLCPRQLPCSARTTVWMSSHKFTSGQWPFGERGPSALGQVYKRRGTGYPAVVRLHGKSIDCGHGGIHQDIPQADGFTTHIVGQRPYWLSGISREYVFFAGDDSATTGLHPESTAAG